jgi:hypothetical protein
LVADTKIMSEEFGADDVRREQQLRHLRRLDLNA